MEKQNVLQLLPLPRELIRLVKEYTYYHKDYILARQRYNQIIHVMNQTICKGQDEEYPYSFWFWSQDSEDPQFQINFCMTCGNYAHLMGTVVPCTC
jgi:hypothetical protein